MYKEMSTLVQDIIHGKLGINKQIGGIWALDGCSVLNMDQIGI